MQKGCQRSGLCWHGQEGLAEGDRGRGCERPLQIHCCKQRGYEAEQHFLGNHGRPGDVSEDERPRKSKAEECGFQSVRGWPGGLGAGRAQVDPPFGRRKRAMGTVFPSSGIEVFWTQILNVLNATEQFT